MVYKPHMGDDCKYNQPDLLNLSNGDKQNDVVIVNFKQLPGKHKNTYTYTM